MQTLLFNTQTKKATLYKAEEETTILYSLENIKTIQVIESGYYELFQIIKKDDTEKSYPVLRVPIAQTNYRIIV